VIPAHEDLDQAITGITATSMAENDPGQLEREAEALRAASIEAATAPAQLALEAAQKTARAAILRARARAMETVQAASEEVARCEAIYESTEEPERVAAGRAFESLQLLQRRHHERGKAYDTAAPVEEIDRLHGLIRDAEATCAGEDARVVEATGARETAFAALEAARAVRREAREALQQVEDSLAEPLTADLPAAEVFKALEFCWPYRVLEAKTGTGPALSPTELAACQALAGIFAGVLGVVPQGAEERIRADERAAAAQEFHRVNITMANGQTANVGQLMGLPSGVAGR
jgi:hypothetical protein